MRRRATSASARSCSSTSSRRRPAGSSARSTPPSTTSASRCAPARHLVGAGLPSLPAQLADATSYAERLYDYRPIGLLDDAAAREALTVPELGGDGPATVADIARAMGKGRTSDISVARVELTKKGLAYAPERGFLAFTVPGMHEFIARQP